MMLKPGTQYPVLVGTAALSIAIGGVASPITATVASANAGNCVGTNVSEWANGISGLKDKYNSASTDETLCLTADIEPSSGELVTPASRTLTIDLNGHDLTITNPNLEEPAIRVAASAGLIITDSSASQEGVLTAEGGAGTSGVNFYAGASGIGGGPREAAGTVTVNGGTVNATGGKGGQSTLYGAGGGAGIGGGGGDFGGDGAVGGTVTVNGGTVNATGGAGGTANNNGNAGAGIGGGGSFYAGTGGGGGSLLLAGTAPKPAQAPVDSTTYAHGHAPTSVEASSSAPWQTQTWGLSANTVSTLTIAFGAPSQVAPAGLTASPGDGGVDLAWDSVTASPAATGYYVEYRLADQTPAADWASKDTRANWESAATSRTVSGLSNGERYEFRVSAINNAFGAGVPSAIASATPGTPSPPANLRATPGDAQVELTWSASTTMGSQEADGYSIAYVEATNPDWSGATTQRATGRATEQATVEGLANGTTYLFRIAATNDNGLSAWSDEKSARPFGAPLQPDTPTATALDGQVRLDWKAPGDNGSAITGYEVQFRESSTSSDWSNAKSQTIDDGTTSALVPADKSLTNGTSYQFRVAAINLGGTGEWSDPATATPVAAEVPTMTLSSSTVVAGGRLTVTATGLEPNEEVTIWVHSSPRRLWSGTADSDGTVDTTIRLPSDLEPGTHRIEIRRANGGESLWARITIAPSLTHTGAGSNLPLLGGAVGLLFASALALLGRRTRAQ